MVNHVSRYIHCSARLCSQTVIGRVIPRAIELSMGHENEYA